jgi:hypothetical protein
MQLRTRPLTDTFGLEILDVDLSDLTDETFDAIYKLWQQEPLLLLRRQSLSEKQQVEYSRRFGEMDIIVRDDMLSPDNPEIIYITNLKRPDGTPGRVGELRGLLAPRSDLSSAAGLGLDLLCRRNAGKRRPHVLLQYQARL